MFARFMTVTFSEVTLSNDSFFVGGFTYKTFE